MSEETRGADSAPESAGAGVDPVAVALALGGASQAEADAFLKKQAHLADLQAKELAHELKLRHWSLLVRHISGVLKLTFEIALAVTVVALAAFLGAAVWNAAHADGVVIESFSVPPDLAARGLTGDVIAGEFLDRLSEINQATISARTGMSYAANWGDDIKVEIPDTGVSVAEAYRFLRGWLGHESHISGAVWREPEGIVITAHAKGKSVTVAGPEADIGGQIRKAAEAVFGLAEPYRYGIYLSSHGRNAEAIAVFRQQVASGSATDRSWGLVGLAHALAVSGDAGPSEQLRLNRQAALLDPANSTALNNVAANERNLSHVEAAASGLRKLRELLSRGDGTEVDDASRLPVRKELNETFSRDLMSSYGEVAASYAGIIRSGEAASFAPLAALLTLAEISDHDLRAARATTRDRDRASQSAETFAFDTIRINANLAAQEQNWPQVVAAASSAGPLLKLRAIRELFLVFVAPVEAYAEARMGRFREADALIATTPADCDECMLQRARIAELEGQHARADWWFARGVHDAPSIPLMYSTWGQALLERGQFDAAIAQFTLANRKGPHFADPLEGWGEALMAKSRSDLALAKFAEASKYAPNWGRLHLKWGEALVYAGNKVEVQKQFVRAGQLALTPSEKSELARQT